MPFMLLRYYYKLEILLTACLCAYPSARQLVMAPHVKGSSGIRLTTKVYNLLREGNHTLVPLSERHGTGRTLASHADMPPFFYLLPFHYMNSSSLVEAWFAAPTALERRRLIDWPPSADANGAYPCPIWKLFHFEDIPKSLYTRPGSGSSKGSRTALHPQIDFIYRLLKAAILNGNIRVTWRGRFRALLQDSSDSTSLLLRRQLILSLILGDVRDVDNYSPPSAIFRHSYTFTSTVENVVCVPLFYQEHHAHHIPGYSLPVLGPTPHPPRLSFYLGVKSQIDDHRQAFSLAYSPPDLEPDPRHTAMTAAATAVATQSAADTATAAALKAMANSAETWARELIDSTREPSAPRCNEFPTLACPALCSPDIDDLAFLSRPISCFSDDETDAPLSPDDSD
jgi:hypothetical protein